jgi:GWxTD domain-containing protein
MRALRGVGRWLIAAGVALSAADAAAQVEMSGTQMEPPGMFNVDAITFAGTIAGRSRLDVFIQVGYEALSFVKRDELYFASYELTLSLYDSTGSLVNEKMWTEEVKNLTFEQSVSSGAYNMSQRSFSLAPGVYQLTTTMRDAESRGARRTQVRIPVSDLTAADFAMSDIMLLARVGRQGEKRSMTPNVSSNVGDVSDPSYIYVEAYNRRKLDSVRIVTSVLNNKREKVLEADTLLNVRPGRNEEILKLSHGALPLGDYRIYLRAYPPGASATLDTGFIAVTNRGFVVRWSGLPRSLKDLDLAIEQLKWIAKDSELKYLREATTPEEKQKRFFEFWKKRDPNPSTPRNEKMEDYYQRVEYANKHFSHYIEGWRTDMGLVYIILGPPGNVERHPFDMDSKPYEIWYYYELNASFTFLDQTGFGDFRLVNPYYEVYDRARLQH